MLNWTARYDYGRSAMVRRIKARRKLGESETFRSEFELSDVGDFDPAGSFACLGGPISNARTAAFLGYESIDRKIPALGLRRRQHCPLRLGIEFEVDSASLAKHGLVVRKGIHALQRRVHVDRAQ